MADAEDTQDDFDPIDLTRRIYDEDMFPGYSVTRMLGKGGMGIVYQAHDINLQRDIAIKTLLPGVVCAHPESQARFLREASTLAKLKHDGLIAVHSYGNCNGLPYFIMEYVDGFDLQQLIERFSCKLIEPWPNDIDELKDSIYGLVMARAFTAAVEQFTAPLGAWNALKAGFQAGSPFFGLNDRDLFYWAALNIIIRVSRTIEYLHGLKVFHRDIKPSNIMVSRKGNVLLMDFGIISVPGSNLTNAGSTPHTPGYVAPEIREGQEADAQTDIYSLGACLYEIVTLNPFIRSRSYAGFLPPSLTTIIDKATDYHRKNRYVSVADFRRDLESHLSWTNKMYDWVVSSSPGKDERIHKEKIISHLAESSDAMLKHIGNLKQVGPNMLVKFLSELPQGFWKTKQASTAFSVLKDDPRMTFEFLTSLPATKAIEILEAYKASLDGIGKGDQLPK